MEVRDKLYKIPNNYPTVVKLKERASNHSTDVRWSYTLQGLPLFPALYHILRKVLKVWPGYKFVPINTRSIKQCQLVQTTPEGDINDEETDTMEVLEDIRLVNSVAVCYPGSEWPIAQITVNLHKYYNWSSPVWGLNRPSTWDRNRPSFTIESPRIANMKKRDGEVNASNVARLMAVFRKIRKPVLGKERIDLLVAWVVGKESWACSNVDLWELRKAKENTQKQFVAMATRAIERIAVQHPDLFTEEEHERIRRRDEALRQHDGNLPSNASGQILYLCEIDELICAKRVGEAGYQWFDSFSALPQRVQESVALLNTQEEAVFSMGVGARFKEGYMVIIEPQEVIRGNATNPREES